MSKLKQILEKKMKFILIVALIACLAVAVLADNSGVVATTSTAVPVPSSSVAGKLESAGKVADKLGGIFNISFKVYSLLSMFKVLF